jgi:serine protease Do
MTRPLRSLSALIALSLAACDARPAVERATDALVDEARAAPPPATRAPMASLVESPNQISDIAERVLPSVVNISSTRMERQEFSSPFGFPFGAPDDRMVPRQGEGSGVIIGADGTIVTNHHVVAESDKLTVTLSDGRSFPAKILGSDEATDVAVIRIEGDPQTLASLPVLGFGDSNALRLGEVVLAVGNPFGLEGTVTMGIVSATGRGSLGITDYGDFIQTDAAINPGNSGGALVNLRGELVGINSAIYSQTGSYAGIGLAIPGNMARRVMDELVKNGRVVRSYLGVGLQDLTPDLAASLGTGVHAGAVINQVEPDSPAARAGLRDGDVITRVDGQTVKSSEQVRNLISLGGVDREITLSLLREGKAQDVQAKLGSRPQDAAGLTGDGFFRGVMFGSVDAKARSRFGIGPEIQTGVIVLEVAPGSEAARVGFEPGDVILSVNRRPISTPEQLEEAERSSSQLLLFVQSGRSRQFVVVPGLGK